MPSILAHKCRCVDQKESAGVAPEMNLMNPLPAGNEAHKQGIHSGFETKYGVTVVIKVTRSRKNRGINDPTKRTDALQKYFLKSSTIGNTS